MNVYVSLFGTENYAWARCLTENVIVTVVDDDLFPFWQTRDRLGFVNYAIRNKKTRRGNIPNKQTASRWYGLMQNVADTEGDYWIHRNGEEIWWTISGSEVFNYVPELDAAHARSYVFRKACVSWSNKDKMGQPLRWSALHPKAKNILSTQSTQIALSEENKEYVLSLLNGGDLGTWHASREWQDALKKTGGGLARTFSARERTIWRIIATVKGTVAGANGQIVDRVLKNKDLLMTDEELRKVIDELIDDQDGVCAISEVPLQLDGEETDKQLLCSLDRIDSSKHYEKGNLQLVCRFINKWKSADSDFEFRRLLGIARSIGGANSKVT
jgi:hypothetical protein